MIWLVVSVAVGAAFMAGVGFTLLLSRETRLYRRTTGRTINFTDKRL